MEWCSCIVVGWLFIFCKPMVNLKSGATKLMVLLLSAHFIVAKQKATFSS